MTEKPDFLALLIGPPKHGKSSLAAEYAEQRLRAGSVVLVQDLNREFSRFCKHYNTEAEFLAVVAAAERAGTTFPGGAAFPLSADRVLALALQLGRTWNQAHGSVRQPICFVVNEVTSFVQSGPTHAGHDLSEAIFQRRHLGLEMIFAMQHAAQLPQLVFEPATVVRMFRQARRDRIQLLEQVLGLERGALEGLSAAPRHVAAGFDQDRGLWAAA